MACKCGYEKQRLFPADVKVYFDDSRTAAPPAFTPEVLMCLECGLTEFKIPDGWNALEAFRRAAR